MRALLGLFLLLALPAAAQPAIAPAMECAALAGQEIAGLRIAAASVVAEGRPAPACHLRGTIGASIGFEAWLPTTAWTGRYLQVGCGGLCGRISPAAPQTAGCIPYERGELAMATSDLGHRDPSAASWGADPARRIDFAFRAMHLTAVAAKAVIARYYGTPARHSYFSGCSDGGREALVAALRYPGDFDGIVAGAPVLNFTVQNTFHHGWTVRQNFGADGRAVLTADRLPVLNRLVLAACDALDGAADGVLADPRACRFDPRAALCAPGADPATCLSAEEARVAAALYDGPRSADGTRLSPGGMALGSEANWRGVIAPASAAEPPRAQLFATGVLRHLAFSPARPAMSVADLRFDAETFAAFGASQAIFDATNPDLAAFAARGGKLIVWHGWADQDIAPANTLAWWAALHRALGAARVEGFARLFMVPGLAHCRDGQGPVSLDTLTPMLRWVEQGAAPDRLVAEGSGGPRPVLAMAALQTLPEPWIGAAQFEARTPVWCLGEACATP
jgi:feruloyl esterase